MGVVEVTLPWDGRVEAARAEKRQTYSPLVEALSGNVFKNRKYRTTSANYSIISLLPAFFIRYLALMGITVHIVSNVPFLNVYYAARTRTPVRFISIEIGSFNQRLSESSRMAVRELYSFTKQVCLNLSSIITIFRKV